MNKLLATSALVAAGLLSSATVTFAQNTPPAGGMQVVVGGFMHQYVGFASNNDGVNFASGNGRAAAGVVSQTNRTSQQFDAEVFIGGRTTLSNGIVIGFNIEIEGNSNNSTGANTMAVAQDNIDESYLFIDGAFGRVLLGSEDDAAFLMHYGAPAMGATWGANEAYVTNWVQPPLNVSILNTTSTLTQADAQRLTYFTPRFSGFQVGASFTPNSLQDANGFVDQRASRSNGWAPSVNYVNTIGGIRVAASAGVSYFPEIDSAAVTTSNGHAIMDMSYGLQLGMGPITVGGGYRIFDNNLAAGDGMAYSLGASYQSGPLAVSASYLESKVNGTATVGDDQFKQAILSASYNMGPGVDLIGSIFSVSYKDEAGGAANNNSGGGAVAGIRLMF